MLNQPDEERDQVAEISRLYQEKKFDDVIRRCTEAESNPLKDSTVAEFHSGALIKQGKMDQAFGYLKDRIREYPESALLHFYLGYVNYGRRNWDEGKKHYKIAGELDPSINNTIRRMQRNKAIIISLYVASVLLTIVSMLFNGSFFYAVPMFLLTLCFCGWQLYLSVKREKVFMTAVWFVAFCCVASVMLIPIL